MIDSKRGAKLLLSILVIFFVAGISADRTGYLITESSIEIRMILIFPLLMVFWYVWIFFYKWGGDWSYEGGRQTIYEINVRQFSGLKGRMQLLLVYIFGFPLLLAIVAWLSIGIPAWLTKFTANESFSHEYIYSPGALIGSGYDFRDAISNKRVSVRISVDLYRDFPDESSSEYIGKVVCLKGRKSAYGSIIESISLGRCSRF